MSGNLEKRYQVFVSSTYGDLREERQEVMQALLELDCIPAGMELFPAANDDQWTLIKRVIDECDYYIVIVAGRYGSIGRDGLSYTEMEYRYAVEQGKPVIGFYHENPGALAQDKSEPTEEGRKKLAEFASLVKQRMCKGWNGPADLGSVVSRSLVRLIKDKPGVGWIRADQAVESLVAPEILKLKRTIEALQAQLQEARTSAPAGAQQLAQGEDRFTVRYTFMGYLGTWQSWKHQADYSWNDIFNKVAPAMMDEANEKQIRSLVDSLIEPDVYSLIAESEKLKGVTSIRNIHANSDDYGTIKIQLRALGLIAKSTKPRSIKDTDTYWTLTPYGDQLLTTMRAIQKAQRIATVHEVPAGESSAIGAVVDAMME